MTRVILNVLGHHAAWWVCVLAARADQAWIGVAFAVVLFAIHLAFSRDRGFEAWSIPLAAGLGYAGDTLITLLGGLRFPDGGVLPAPLWIAALWLAFATTLNTAFRWLRSRPGTAFIIGAVFGPAAYLGGALFDVVALPNLVRGIVLLVMVWGLLMPVLAVLGTQAAKSEAAEAVVASEVS
jgi:hypothetical protein